ncbi:MAG: hypothetical protein ACI9SC_001410 [Gammaproteobacteria bacterium]|jgi:hypothetical protein
MSNQNDIENQIRSVLEALLEPISFIDDVELLWEATLAEDAHADFIAIITIGEKSIKLLAQFKKNLQPRFVLDAIRQVKENSGYIVGEPVYPLIVSDYISPRSAEILVERNISYFDLTGNCRLDVANIYIEKSGEKNRALERRGLKSLFGLKSSRMLRLLMSDPIRSWQVKELASGSMLSFGQVSNVRRALLDQGYAVETQARGIQLTQPGALLHDWRALYKKPVTNENKYYTLLTGEERQNAIKTALKEAELVDAGLMLSGLSAARWLAPFTKTTSESFYADKQGLAILKEYLALDAVNSGPNIIIEEPKDSFIFKESIECAPGLRCTSAIQTYLDLYVRGEREQEAAEHIETHVLRNKWKNII